MEKNYNCSLCDKELSEEEIKENMKKGTTYYPVCEDCLLKHSMKVMKIIFSED